MGAEPERPNLVARLKGDEPGPVLGYLSHVDTVLADPDDWTHDPWSGEIHDGYLWGRGALDMKSQTAAEAVAAATLAREGWRPARGELKLIGGRRRGGRRAARRPVADRAAARRRPRGLAGQRGRRTGDALRRPAALLGHVRREGHLPLPRDRTRRGRPRLVPGHRRQRAAQARARAGAARRAPAGVRRRWPSRARCSRRSARTRTTRRPRSTACARSSRAWRSMVEPTLRVTAVPTRIFASEKINVIPARARAAGRLPRAAGHGRRGGHAADPRADRRRRAGGRVHGAGRRQPLADRHAADGRHPRLARRARPRRRGGPLGAPGLHRLALVPRRLP